MHLGRILKFSEDTVWLQHAHAAVQNKQTYIRLANIDIKQLLHKKHLLQVLFRSFSFCGFSFPHDPSVQLIQTRMKLETPLYRTM